MNGHDPLQPPPDATPAEAATPLKEATPVSLRTQFRSAVAPVEATLDTLETAQHREAQAVATEKAAQDELDVAATARLQSSNETVVSKEDVRGALGDLGTFLTGLQAELDQ